jgi:hypothetical protein
MSTGPGPNIPINAAALAGALAAVPSARFPPNSRYATVGTAELKLLDGRTIVYLRRRFVPPPDRFELMYERTVKDGERLDVIAATELGDPEQFWRLCDANNAIHPEELIEIGRFLRITMPEGIPGPQGVQ